MRRKFFAAWLLALVMALLCAVPALAVPEDGVYTYILDGADVLDEYDMDALEERASYVASNYGFAPYVVTVETLSGMDASDAALSYYDEYAMGAGSERVGAILLVSADDGSYSFLVLHSDEVDEQLMTDMEAAFLESFDEGWYEGFAQYIQGFVTFFSSGPSPSAADGDIGGIDGAYILDLADILTDEQENALEEKAGSIARTYGFAPCVIVEESLEGWDPEDLARAYYGEHEMGIGADNNGSLLYMSMEDRDFWYLLEDHDSKVFDEYRYNSVQEAFLKEFRDDDWYGGFSEYLNATEHYLSGAADNVDHEAGEDWNYYGDYVPDYADTGRSFFDYLLMFGVPVLIALLISLGLLSKMKTVRVAAEAGSYLKGNLKLHVKEDIYTHTTETRVKVESESKSGGSHGGGGGGSFSGGGKF